MSVNPKDLTTRLLACVTPNGKVKNLHTVMEILKILETTKLTISDLQETRLGKYVNDIRRKNTEEALLNKKARKLIRSWQAIATDNSSQPNRDVATQRKNAPNVNPKVPTTNQIRKKPAINTPTEKSKRSSVATSNNNHTTTTNGHSNQSLATSAVKRKSGTALMTSGSKKSKTHNQEPTSFTCTNVKDFRFILKTKETTNSHHEAALSSLDKSPNSPDSLDSDRTLDTSSSPTEHQKINKTTKHTNNVPPKPVHQKPRTREDLPVHFNVHDDPFFCSTLHPSKELITNRPADQKHGTNGYVGDNGKWYPWIDSILLKHRTQAVLNDPNDQGLLCILPYVEIE